MKSHVLLRSVIRAVWLLGGLILLGLVAPASAGRPEQLIFRGTEFIAYWVDLDTEDLGLCWKDASGQPLTSFVRLRQQLSASSRELKFAINAGIFSPNQVPLGLHVEDFKMLHPLNLGELEGGQGNFYLKPNGVFYLVKHEPAIVASEEYAKLGLRPRLACQSGPLLVSEGRLHPAFRADSANFHWRTGVGVTREHKIVFVLSRGPLRFHDFARLFKERLDCDNALYLDGDICSIYLPELGYRAEGGTEKFAAMFAVTTKLKPDAPAPRAK